MCGPAPLLLAIFFLDGPFGLGVLSISGEGAGAEAWGPKMPLPVVGRILSVGDVVAGSPLITATWTKLSAAHSESEPGLSARCIVAGKKLGCWIETVNRRVCFVEESKYNLQVSMPYMQSPNVGIFP